MTGPHPAHSSRRKGIALTLGGAVLTAAAISGGVWGYRAFYGQGAQPAEVLQADGVLAYAAVDLSPNGQQLLAAREALGRFPGLREAADLDSKNDLRKILFEQAQGGGECRGITYDEDVAPLVG